VGRQEAKARGGWTRFVQHQGLRDKDERYRCGVLLVPVMYLGDLLSEKRAGLG